MSLIDVVQRAVQRDGEALTLRRIATGVAPIDVAVIGVVREFAAHELVGSVIQGDRRVVMTDAEIAAASWPGPPRKGDQVLIGGAAFAVQGCNTVRLGGLVAKHEMRVRG